jgi:hypothetical protein
MKRTFILPFFAVLAAAVLFTSCRPSRVWTTKKKEPKEYRERDEDYNDYRYSTPPPPPPQSYHRPVALILTPSPGFTMRQSPDGRFYHRSMQGLLYWKGYDNRFYLDRAELGRVSYSRYEYDEWRRYSRQSR